MSTVEDQKLDLESGITWSKVKCQLNKLAIEQGQWGGMPLPIDELKLSLSERYPNQKFNGLALSTSPEKLLEEIAEQQEAKDLNLEFVNSWYSPHRGTNVVLYKENGKVKHALLPAERAGKRLYFIINTLGVAASQAWTIEAEYNAMQKLHTHISDHAMKCYLLSGTFLETSKKSNVTYLFRKLRPTIALHVVDELLECLTVLCIHPMGYYEESWGGVMVPTDCVLTQLLLMRADERKFWSKANHLEMHLPNAGI